MMWGHKISQRDSDPIEVTRAEYNQVFGAPVPEQPEIPECGFHAWEIWWRLNARRPSGESQTPVSYSEMRAFCDMTGVLLMPEDVMMIEAIDNAFLVSVSEERKGAFDRAREENKTSKPKGKKL